MTRERPILFSAPMVRAILTGTKTQTRRAVKFNAAERMQRASKQWHRDDPDAVLACPYGQPGDGIWVRETWQAFFADELPADRPRGPRHTMGIPARPDRLSYVYYRADGEVPPHPDGAPARWYPSIHLPRKYSRIDLRITDVRVERLQDISEADAYAEGVECEVFDQTLGCRNYARDDGWFIDWPGFTPDRAARESFRTLWESINGPGSWDANPWVWALTFERIKP